MNNTAKIIGGFLAGAALGVAAGVLIAPESGRKTRKKIADRSKEMSDHLADSVSKTMDTVKSSYNKKLDEYASTGKSSIDAVKDKIKV
jgi:gas vesicle protein